MGKHKIKRSEEREFAFKMLYASEFNDESYESQIKRLDKEDYQVEYIPVDVYKVANQEQVIPSDMIDGNNVTKAFFDYIYPLIEGEFTQVYKNGVQQFFKL